MTFYFDGACRPNPGPISIAVVHAGNVDLHAGLGEGSSGDAEWLALLHAMEVATASGARDVLLLGDSAGVIAQANGSARFRGPPGANERLASLRTNFVRLRFRHVRRNQNLAGIALEQDRQSSLAQ